MVNVPYYYSESKKQWMRMRDMNPQHLINAFARHGNARVKVLDEKVFRIKLDTVVTDSDYESVYNQLQTLKTLYNNNNNDDLANKIFENLEINEVE